MEITPDELMTRLRAARNQEDMLMRAIGGRDPLIAREELPARIDALGSTYQAIIIGMGIWLEQHAESPVGD